MFAHDSIDFKSLTQRAREYVLSHDRHLFIPALRAIEQFAAERKMIIGGRAGTHALCKLPIDSVDVDMWVLELFSQNVERDMLDCLERITAQLRKPQTPIPGVKEDPTTIYSGDYRTITLRTSIPSREYRLWADYRLVAIGYSLGERKGVDMMGIIAPIITTGAFGTKDAHIMPHEMQIMRFAHLLCNPMTANNWSSYLAQMCSLFDLPASKSAAIDGADDTREAPGREAFALKNGVLIGEFAVEYYTGITTGNRARPQYACSFDGIDEFAKDQRMTVREADVRVPDDFSLRKIILRNHSGEIIADLFNALEYEPMPVNEIAQSGRAASDRDTSRKCRGSHSDGIRDKKICPSLIASPIAVLRFLFIEIWALSFVIELQQDKTPLRRRQDFLRNLARRLFSWIIDKGTVAVLFPTKFQGTFVSETTLKRARSHGYTDDTGPRSAISKEELIKFGCEIIARMQIV